MGIERTAPKKVANSILQTKAAIIAIVKHFKIIAPNEVGGAQNSLRAVQFLNALKMHKDNVFEDLSAVRRRQRCINLYPGRARTTE